MSYVLMVDRLERATLCDRLVAATLLVGGSAEAEAPTVADAIAEFDTALAAPPVPESANERLLRELGLV